VFATIGHRGDRRDHHEEGDGIGKASAVLEPGDEGTGHVGEDEGHQQPAVGAEHRSAPVPTRSLVCGVNSRAVLVFVGHPDSVTDSIHTPKSGLKCYDQGMDDPALVIKELRFSHTAEGGAPFTLSLDAFQLDRGEQALMVGTSGSGKSTLLQLIAGLLDPESGTIRINGSELHAMGGAGRDRFRGRSIGMIFQTFNLLDGFSARENVLTALMFSDLPAREHGARADELLGGLGIDRPDATPDRLSVGQQQRVAVARALACRPGLVLADEPTASLDPDNAANAVRLIKESCAREGAALLMTSHDPQLRDAFDRVEDLDA
jgi:ABC-type lipoprotein export system ATPase subunit